MTHRRVRVCAITSIPGGARILRGGCTNDRKAANVVTHRYVMLPEMVTALVGFRCVLTAQ